MKNSFVKILISATLVAVSFTASAAETDNTVKILGSNTDPFSLIGLLPTFCKKQGLDVQYTQRPSSGFDASAGMVMALDRQGYDLATGALGAALIAVSKGSDIRAFANITAGGSALIARPGTNGYKDLKGKKIAILKGQHGEQIVSDALAKNGMNITGPNPDVTVISLQTDVQPIAYEQGLIDGFNATYPFSQELINSGKAVLIEDYKQIARALYTTSKLPKQKEERLHVCYQDMMNAVNDPKRIKEIEAAQEAAKVAGYKALTPPKTQIAYVATPILKNEDIAGLIRFLRSIDKVPTTFTAPADFNQSFKFKQPK